MCDTGEMEQRTDAWVVIPAYNEAPVIGGVVTGVRAAFPHVLVVDDASSDDTAAIARSAGAYTATHPLNLGQGAALQTGVPSQVGSLKRAMLRLGAAAARARTGMTLTDTHNGLRVIRADALSHVHLTHARMAHASQIVSQLAASGLRGAEHPVTISYTDYSRAKGQPLLNSVNIVVDLALGGR